MLPKLGWLCKECALEWCCKECMPFCICIFMAICCCARCSFCRAMRYCSSCLRRSRAVCCSAVRVVPKLGKLFANGGCAGPLAGGIEGFAQVLPGPGLGGPCGTPI